MRQRSTIRWGALLLALCFASCDDGRTSAEPQLPVVPTGPYATLGDLEDDVAAARGAGVPDTDGDSLPDSIEARLATDPGDRDSDRDGLSDNFELFGAAFERDDLLPDADRDGVLAPLDSDDDADRINDGEVVDTDGDGIANYLEYYGYTYDFLTGRFLAWGGGASAPHFFTDPLQVSTDQDAYSDATEASGAFLDPSIEDPGTDPLVPAYPNIVVELAGYTVTLNEAVQITQGESLEKGRTWTRETERSYSHTYEAGWQVGGEVSLGAEPGVKVSANYSWKNSDTNSTTTSVAIGESVTATENWSLARSLNPTDAARIKVFLKVHNRGTAPLSSLIPTLTLKIGGLNVVTFEPGNSSIHMLVPGGTYPSEAGVYWTVSAMAGGTPLSLTMTELRALERGAPVSLTVTQTRGDVMRLTQQATWERIGDANEYVARCDAVCANLRIDLGDGQVIHQLVYSDDSPSAHPMTAGDALRRLGVDGDGLLHYADLDGVPRSRSLTDFTFAFDDDTLRANGWTLAGDGASETSPPPGFVLEGLRLLPDTTLVVRAPRDPGTAPGPVIHFAYLDSLSGEVSVSAADYQGLLSVEVTNEDGSSSLPLAEDIPGAGFYSGVVPGDSEGLLKVVVENLAGTRAEADLGRLFVTKGPQRPVINALTLDLGNRSLYANVASGNPGDALSDFKWVRAYHPLLPGGFLTMERTIYFFEDPEGYTVELPPAFAQDITLNKAKDIEVVAFVTDGVFERRKVQWSDVIGTVRTGTVTLDADTDWVWYPSDVYDWHVASLDLDAGVKRRVTVTWYADEPFPDDLYEDVMLPGEDLSLRVLGSTWDSPAFLYFGDAEDYVDNTGAINDGRSYGARLRNVDFDALTQAEIAAAVKSRNPLQIGAPGGIEVNDILAMRTSSGYAKVQVMAITSGYGKNSTYKSYDVTVRYVAYRY